MGTINSRVKEIRKYYNLTQKQFGSKIGMRQNSIALIERSERNLSSKTIVAICREFKVNEKWLCDGEGDMFSNENYEEEVNNFLKQVISADRSDIRKRFAIYLSRLSDSDWECLDQLLNSIIEEKDVLFP